MTSKSESPLVQEDARSVLLGLARRINLRKAEMNIFDILLYILSINHYPVTWTEEKTVAATFRVSSNYVQTLIKTLRSEGWKPTIQ